MIEINSDLAREVETMVFKFCVLAMKPDRNRDFDLKNLQEFNDWIVGGFHSIRDLNGILTGVHNCRQRHLLDALLEPGFYHSATAKPDKKFVKELISMYYDSVIHYMKCI